MAAITELLGQWRDGEAQALDGVIESLYQELRRAASGCLRRSPRQSLQPTILVHEAYLRLAARTPGPLKDRKHFLALAAKVMRYVLVDRLREASAKKRAHAPLLSLEFDCAGVEFDLDGFLLLDQALHRLTEQHPEWTPVIELRYFAGLDLAETAEVLQISVSTVARRQNVAEAWLQRELSQARPEA